MLLVLCCNTMMIGWCTVAATSRPQAELLATLPKRPVMLASCAKYPCRPVVAQTELVELTAELMSGAGGAHIGYEACPSPNSSEAVLASTSVYNVCESTMESRGLRAACKPPGCTAGHHL